MTLENRPRGILSPADRRYLTHPEEYSDQAAYERRGAIVTRVHEALHDFPALVANLEEERRREAFEDRDLEHKEHTINVLSSAFAFLYLGITDTVEPPELAKDAFEDIVASGVQRAYLERGEPVANVDVSVEVTEADETKPPGAMTLTEMQQLNQTGDLGREEFIETIADRIQFAGESLSPPEDVNKSRGEWLADLFGITEDTEE
jgi:hypothetical protein